MGVTCKVKNFFSERECIGALAAMGCASSKGAQGEGADASSAPPRKEEERGEGRTQNAQKKEEGENEALEKLKAEKRAKAAARTRRSSSELVVAEVKGEQPRRGSSKINDGVFESSDTTFEPKSIPSKSGADFENLDFYIEDGVETLEADSPKKGKL